MDKHIVKTLPINTLGRDFVVGDIHGAFDLVVRAMRAVNFDYAKDRLFSTGDLIDRGPDSGRCLKFLAQPYVHAVRGNHEEMLLELYEDGPPDPIDLDFAMRHNGFGWWADVPEEERQTILAAFRELPVVIETETTRGTVGFVHADVPPGMDWQEFKGRLQAGDKEVREIAQWSRDRVRGNYQCGVVGIGRLFVGHSPQWDGIKRLGNIYVVDTGAVFGVTGKQEEGRLTMADLKATTVYFNSPAPAGNIDIRLDDGSASDRPFGQYAQSEKGEF